jgi:heme-degrading monooxygenase HmoA
MFARTSTWKGSPEVLERWAEHVVAHVRPAIEKLAAGNVGAVFLIDRSGGRALTLTIWESEAAARASDEFAEQSRAKTIEATGIELVERGRYEVVARRARGVHRC